MLSFAARAERAAAAADKDLFRSAESFGTITSPIWTSSEIVRSIPSTRSRPHLGSKILNGHTEYRVRIRTTMYGVPYEFSVLRSTDSGLRVRIRGEQRQLCTMHGARIYAPS